MATVGPASQSGAGIAKRLVGALAPSLHGYRREWAGADLVAGVTLLAIALPEQLATSRLAGMPPVTGFYAFVAGSALIAFLGSNPHMSVGADSTIAPLFAVGISHLAPLGSASYVDLVGILAVSVGVLVTLVGVLRLGWISEFLSTPIITGFLAGVSIVIVVHQVPDLLGVPGAGGSTLHRLHVYLSHLDKTNGWSLGIAVAVFATVVGAERMSHKVPGALLGLVASTLVVGGFGLENHGVAVLGTFAHGAPHVGLVGLSWSTVKKVFPVAGVVALVVVSQTAATTAAFGDDGGGLAVNRDFVGVGAGSIVAGLVGSFPVNASPPRTAAVAASKGRTQAAGLGAAAALVALIPAASLLKDLPAATLGAILVFVASRIFHARDLVQIGRFDRLELGLAVVTTVTVALVGVEQGIGVAVALAILDRTRLSARPQLHVLGRIPGTTSWAPLRGKEQEVPGILVVLFATPLWYANASHFHAELDKVVARGSQLPKAVVLDTIGMGDIDYTGFRVLCKVLDELQREGISFAVARAGEHVIESLKRSGLADRIGKENFYSAVDEAVVALGRQPKGEKTS